MEKLIREVVYVVMVSRNFCGAYGRCPYRGGWMKFPVTKNYTSFSKMQGFAVYKS